MTKQDPQADHDALVGELKTRYKQIEGALKAFSKNHEYVKGFVDRLLAGLQGVLTWKIDVRDSEGLKSAVQEFRTGVLGFSYGIGNDGSPGKTNIELARFIADDLAASNWSRVYVQWEIADALKLNHNATLPSHCVSWPPQFLSEELLDPVRLATRLISDSDVHVRQVYAHFSPAVHSFLIDWLASSGCDNAILRGILVFALNDLLHDGRFHHGVVRPFPLKPLDRGLMTETRELPERSDSLSPGQTVRLNRLILERLFPAELKEGRYLNTQGVVDDLADTMEQDNITTLILVAHPVHVVRCYRLAKAVLAKLNPNVIVADTTKVQLDLDSAQSCTRTIEAAWKYEILGRFTQVALELMKEEAETCNVKASQP